MVAERICFHFPLMEELTPLQQANAPELCGVSSEHHGEEWESTISGSTFTLSDFGTLEESETTLLFTLENYQSRDQKRPMGSRAMFMWERSLATILCPQGPSKWADCPLTGWKNSCFLASVSEAQSCFSHYSGKSVIAKLSISRWLEFSFTYLFAEVKTCPPTSRLVQRNKIFCDT